MQDVAEPPVEYVLAPHCEQEPSLLSNLPGEQLVMVHAEAPTSAVEPLAHGLQAPPPSEKVLTPHGEHDPSMLMELPAVHVQVGGAAPAALQLFVLQAFEKSV